MSAATVGGGASQHPDRMDRATADGAPRAYDDVVDPVVEDETAPGPLRGTESLSDP